MSSVLPILILLGALGEGIAVGTASLASRLLGARDQENANRAATTGLAIAVLTGIAVSVTLPFHIGDALRLFGVTPSALPLAEAYLRVALCGTVLLMLQIFGDFLAISEGNTRFSMWVLIAAFGINAVLDPIFIFVFGWGVTGAAAATLVAQMTAAAIYLGYFALGLGRLRIAPRFLTANSPHPEGDRRCRRARDARHLADRAGLRAGLRHRRRLWRRGRGGDRHRAAPVQPGRIAGVRLLPGSAVRAGVCLGGGRRQARVGGAPLHAGGEFCGLRRLCAGDPGLRTADPAAVHQRSRRGGHRRARSLCVLRAVRLFRDACGAGDLPTIHRTGPAGGHYAACAPGLFPCARPACFAADLGPGRRSRQPACRGGAYGACVRYHPDAPVRQPAAREALPPALRARRSPDEAPCAASAAGGRPAGPGSRSASISPSISRARQ